MTTEEKLAAMEVLWGRASDLLILVEKLRTAQRGFFKTRDSAYLYESKSLEKIVDKKLEEILHGKQEQLI